MFPRSALICMNRSSSAEPEAEPFVPDNCSGLFPSMVTRKTDVSKGAPETDSISAFSSRANGSGPALPLYSNAQSSKEERTPPMLLSHFRFASRTNAVIKPAC